jgi:hypothetical protein
MSINPNTNDPGLPGVTENTEDQRLREIEPKLVQTDPVEIEFQPQVVTRLGGTLPWDTESRQLQCGETVVDNNDDFNIRLNMECVANHDQFRLLQRMRANPSQIKLVSAAYSGPVTFDELRFDRITDANGAVTPTGPDEQPMYQIQLQSKEESE